MAANTVVGIRRGDETVLAADGMKVSPGGLVLRHKTRIIEKAAGGRLLFAASRTEAPLASVSAVLTSVFDLSGRDPRAACVKAAEQLGTGCAPINRSCEFVVVARGFVGYLSSAGEFVEPDEGFVAIGGGAPSAAGAIKALLAHSQLSADGIAREALRIAAQLTLTCGEEICLEVI